MRCLLVALLFQTSSQAQFSSLGKHERQWALFHPFAAMKVRAINAQCTKIYDQKKMRAQLDSFAAGGKLDAYRHVFFMAAFAQKVRVKKVRKLGVAHEKTNYRQFLQKKLEEGEKPDSLSSVMDLLNNELGIKIGCNYRNLTLADLSSLVIRKINDGEARIFMRNQSGRYVDCDQKEIELNLYTQRWHVPKCLVSSSAGYSP